MATVTETFTHADQVGDLTADNHWTRLAGTPGADWGIVSNQAKISGNASSGSDYRMDTVIDKSQIVTLQVTRVSQAGGLDAGNPTFFSQFGIYVSDGTTNNNYAWYSVRPAIASVFENYTLGKTVGGVFTQLDQINQVLVANDVMKLTWNPATGDLNGYVNNILISSKNDTALTNLQYGNLNGYTNDPAFVAIADPFSIAEARPVALGGPRSRFFRTRTLGRPKEQLVQRYQGTTDPVPAALSDRPSLLSPGFVPGLRRNPRYRFLASVQGLPSVVVAPTVVFRKTLSSVGTKTGSRQPHNTE